jgi:hypothetical protein
VLDSLPETFELLDDILIDIGQFQFPTPFLKIRVEEARLEWFTSSKPHNPAFRELHPEELLFSQLVEMRKNDWKRPRKRWLVLGEVTLSDGKTKVLRDFKKWLDTLPPFKIPMGKERNPPWHKLKDLAAYRLSEIGGLTYAQAMEEARRVGGIVVLTKPHKVLPIYKSLGAYSDAVKRAATLIEQMFPLPYQLRAST